MAEAQVPLENNQNNGESAADKWTRLKQEREDYFEKLRKWLDAARLFNSNAFSGLPFNNLNIDASNSTSTPHQLQQQQINNLNATLAQANLWNENLQNILRHRFHNNVTTNRNGVTSQFLPTASTQTPSTYEFVIPSLWKRVVAEFMDFLILFFAKMALTLVLIESFDIIEIGFKGFESFQKNLENPDVTMPTAIEWLTMEVLHRIIVFSYETCFLRGNYCATPGKRYMGLMVVTVENMSPVPGRIAETISVTGAAPLGWQKSLTRAAIKNLFVGLFLPLCVAFYIFPHNRTSYDMMANSIVVEYHQEFYNLN